MSTESAAGRRANARHSFRAVRGLTVLGLHLGSAAISLVMAFPFLWMVSSSLKPATELFRFPPALLPNQWHWENYSRAWQAARFSRYFGNSLVIAVGGTLLTLAVCSLAAYAFSKLQFQLRDALFWLVLGSQMIPGIVTLIPSFLVVKSIPLAGGNDWLGRGGYGWLNSYTGLIVPGAGAAFGVFLLRQFFMTVPDDLLDAARIDGCGDMGIFARIVMPLSRPSLAALSIFTFQGYWNDFIWPLVITSQDRFRTIQLGLMVFRQRFTADWGPLMAGVTIATGPMLLVFILAQRYFVRGIALTGMREG